MGQGGTTVIASKSGLGNAIVTQSATASGGSAADLVIANAALRANDLMATAFIGSCLRCDVMGNTDNAAAGGTFTAWIKLGSTKISTLSWALPASAQTAKPWWAVFFVTCRTQGAGGTLLPQGHGYHSGMTFGATAFVLDYHTATTAVDTTVNETLQFGIAWTAAVSGNIGRVDHCSWHWVSGPAGP